MSSFEAFFFKTLRTLKLGSKRGDSEGTVISFPKSGRTWLRVMLDRLGVSMHYTHAGSQHSLGAHHQKLGIRDADLQGSRLLFLHRDPRDTAVSGYFQKTLRVGEGCEIGMADFMRHPCMGLEKVLIFNLLWLEEAAELPNFRSVRYEDLRCNTVNGLSAIVQHVQPSRRLEAENVQRVVEESSFQRMQEQEKSGELAKQYGGILAPTAANNPESFKVRRGKVGGYVDYFSEDDLRYADALLEQYDYFRRVERAVAKTGLVFART